jgi:hypothetical protein
MTGEPQKSLAGYKSKVHEQGEFDNPNDGKPLLNDSEEYVMRLTEFPHVKTFPQIKENKKTGERKTIQVDKAICVFEDEVTHNIVTAFFRVDSLNFSEDEAFESGIVRFFKKIKAPLPENGDIEWGNHFIVGMRFRGRVAVGVDDKKVPNGKYFLDVPTCRPILPSDKNDGTATASKPDASLANALLLCKGASDFNTAMSLLQSAQASKEVTMALFQANLDGKVTFPI